MSNHDAESDWHLTGSPGCRLQGPQTRNGPHGPAMVGPNCWCPRDNKTPSDGSATAGLSPLGHQPAREVAAAPSEGLLRRLLRVFSSGQGQDTAS